MDQRTIDQVDERIRALADLTGTYSPLVASLELARATQYGDSYGNNAVGSTADLTSAFMWRVCSRLRTQTLTDRSVSATRSDQIQQRIASTWTAPSRGIVLLADILLNDAFQNRDGSTFAYTARSILEYLSALDIAAPTASSIQYGSNWAAGVSSTANAYADVAFTGDAVVIAALAGTTGGTFRIRDSTGTVRATVNTGGWSDPFGLTTRIDGFGNGNHTVRLEVISGTVTLANIIVPSTAPPLIVWWIPGNLAGTVGTAQNAKLPPFRTIAATVAAQFANVLQVTVGSDWDPATMLSSDLTHYNDKGNAYAASRVLAALLARPFAQGQNRLAEPTAYTAPAPAFSTPSATAPAPVTNVTATTGYQVTVGWTPATDGGATLTGYTVQASSDSGTTWTDAGTAGPSFTSLQIVSGLTPATSYQFRVKATNTIGSTASTSTATATAGPVLVTYSADPLTGSGVMGTAQTGGQAWNIFSGVAFARNTDGAGVTTSITDRNFCLVDDGQANGTMSLTVGTTGGIPGLYFNAATDFSTGYLFWNNSGTWTLSKQTALTTRSPLSTVAGTMNAGDVLTVVKNGSSITCKVNGATVLTATDATYSGTRHGLYSYSSTSARFKTWQHTS